MLRKVAISAFFSSFAALATAQSTVTLYDLSVAAPSGTGQSSNVVFDILEAAGDIKASAVAVIPGGEATFYIGERPVTVVPTIVSGRITTAILPTPSTETLTFLADASRILNGIQTTTTIQGYRVEGELIVDCRHNVDDDTPVEDARVVCRQEGVYNVEASGVTLESTVLATQTGDARAIATVTIPAGLRLPTVGAETTSAPEVTDLFETTSRRLPPQTTHRPIPDEEPEDEEPDSDTTGLPGLIPEGNTGFRRGAPGATVLGFLGAVAILTTLL